MEESLAPITRISDQMLTRVLAFVHSVKPKMKLVGVSKRFQRLIRDPMSWRWQRERLIIETNIENNQNLYTITFGEVNENFTLEKTVNAVSAILDRIRPNQITIWFKNGGENQHPLVSTILARKGILSIWDMEIVARKYNDQEINDVAQLVFAFKDSLRVLSCPLGAESWRFNTFWSRSSPYLYVALSSCANLRSLELFFYPLTPSDARSMAESHIIQSLSNKPQLKALDLLQIDDLSNDGLAKICQRSPLLERLKFYGCRLLNAGKLLEMDKFKKYTAEGLSQFVVECRTSDNSWLKMVPQVLPNLRNFYAAVSPDLNQPISEEEAQECLDAFLDIYKRKNNSHTMQIYIDAPLDDVPWKALEKGKAHSLRRINQQWFLLKTGPKDKLIEVKYGGMLPLNE